MNNVKIQKITINNELFLILGVNIEGYKITNFRLEGHLLYHLGRLEKLECLIKNDTKKELSKDTVKNAIKCFKQKLKEKSWNFDMYPNPSVFYAELVDTSKF